MNQRAETAGPVLVVLRRHDDYSVIQMCLAVAVLQGLDDEASDRLVAALVGDQQQAGQVKRDARAADDGQDDEGDPDDRG